jgi:hypothetical protein
MWKKSNFPRSVVGPLPGHHERSRCVCDTRLLAQQECIHQGEPLPRRLRIDQDLFERGKTLANHPRTTDRMRIAFGWGFMQDRIQMKGGDKGHLLLLTVQAQFQDTVGGIAQQRDRQGGKPAAHQADHLTRPHPDCLVAFAQGRAHRRCRGQHTQKGQGSMATTAMTIQRSPGLLTDRLRLESTLSR